MKPGVRRPVASRQPSDRGRWRSRTTSQLLPRWRGGRLPPGWSGSADQPAMLWHDSQAPSARRHRACAGFESTPRSAERLPDEGGAERIAAWLEALVAFADALLLAESSRVFAHRRGDLARAQAADSARNLTEARLELPAVFVEQVVERLGAGRIRRPRRSAGRASRRAAGPSRRRAQMGDMPDGSSRRAGRGTRPVPPAGRGCAPARTSTGR